MITVVSFHKLTFLKFSSYLFTQIIRKWTRLNVIYFNCVPHYFPSNSTPNNFQLLAKCKTLLKYNL